VTDRAGVRHTRKEFGVEGKGIGHGNGNGNGHENDRLGLKC